MTINKSLLEKTARALITDSAEREAFIQALLAGGCSERALIWLADRPEPSPFQIAHRLSWQPPFVDWVRGDEQPGKSEFHSRGDIYCFDLSSAFAASALLPLYKELQSPLVLDLCAAPGGKGICAWKMLRPRLLVANEVIGKRIPALISNLERCKVRPSAVVRHDPSIFAQHFGAAFDAVIVDAPCSGQSLIAKGEDSPGCFHPSTVNMNSNRQKRIIANAAAAVAPGGYLAYMTCTYAEQENELVVSWLRKKFPAFCPMVVDHLSEYQSQLADFPCYRLWPQRREGAGAFVALLQNQVEGKASEFDRAQLHLQWSSW